MARSAILAWLFVWAGCIGTTPEEQLRADQGSARDGDPEHRPGQPCLVCHGADYDPGGKVFALAGTVYLLAGDPDDGGLEGAAVNVLDSAGHEFSALTNRVGNFMVWVESDLVAPAQRERGQLVIPWQPVFPLTVGVQVGDADERAMESQIWRDGSCARCHLGSEGGADHVEKVWAVEAAP